MLRARQAAQMPSGATPLLLCFSQRPHGTGLGVAGFAIRSRRGRHRPRASPRSPNGPIRARMKPPDSPAATRSKRRGPPLRKKACLVSVARREKRMTECPCAVRPVGRAISRCVRRDVEYVGSTPTPANPSHFNLHPSMRARLHPRRNALAPPSPQKQSRGPARTCRARVKALTTTPST